MQEIHEHGHIYKLTIFVKDSEEVRHKYVSKCIVLVVCVVKGVEPAEETGYVRQLVAALSGTSNGTFPYFAPLTANI